MASITLQILVLVAIAVASESAPSKVFTFDVLAFLQRLGMPFASQSASVSIQEDLDSAIDDFFDTLSHVGETIAATCKYLPNLSAAEEKLFDHFVAGEGAYQAAQDMCKLFKEESAEAFPKFISNVKGKGKEILNFAQSLCDHKDSAKDFAAEDEFVNIVCPGLEFFTPSVVKALLDTTIRAVAEEEKIAE